MRRQHRPLRIDDQQAATEFNKCSQAAEKRWSNTSPCRVRCEIGTSPTGRDQKECLQGAMQAYKTDTETLLLQDSTPAFLC